MSEVTQDHDTIIKVSTGKTEAAVTIKSISSTFPAVVELDGELALKTYDVVVITGAMPDQVNGLHQIKMDGTKITLMGDTVADFTDIGAIDVSKAKIAKMVMSSWCQATGFDVVTFEIEKTDESVLCKKAKQTVTKANPGTASLDNFYKGNLPLTNSLRKAARNGQEIFLQAQHEDGTVWGWRAVITKFDYSAKVNSKMTLKMDLQFNSLEICEDYE